MLLLNVSPIWKIINVRNMIVRRSFLRQLSIDRARIRAVITRNVSLTSYSDGSSNRPIKPGGI